MNWLPGKMLRVKPYLLDEFIPCVLPSGNACRQNEEKGVERKCTQGGNIYYGLRYGRCFSGCVTGSK